MRADRRIAVEHEPRSASIAASDVGVTSTVSADQPVTGYPRQSFVFRNVIHQVACQATSGSALSVRSAMACAALGSR